ncbi:radical SAM protein [Brevirhabdus pacifica]|uniref:Radical SAM protein n=1 Tax=Brevirhabdus pacifica TaxID=1267768 RepID=A0A1U7DES6_9RHOB|nr:radical SAM protein [Brevirhabdus pacifica]APX88510.1 radical SAM protein [Brevirhabdus pacifica]OWU79810.1 radical SAM protein [Loktanella sp. 22II-4b]PJJ87010.1 4Fe-4S single cluster protein [Brevirhabdus pacifica]
MKDDLAQPDRGRAKFVDPAVTADGQARATVALHRPQTLWFNTGTLCNIECVNCYIESSPTNDRLAYLLAEDVTDYLDQIEARGWPIEEIGFTGGEPFMNPQILSMLEQSLARGYRVLVLTNAMRPMMRRRVREGLELLRDAFGDRLTLRISVDHWSAKHHDEERGKGSFDITLQGMRWLRDGRFRMSVAGRTVWGETEAEAREGYARLYRAEGFDIDAQDPGNTVLFPEMDENVDVPEITTACWDILGKSPQSVMCSNSRMVVRRKGAAGPAVLACTLLPYAPGFELGTTLAEAERDVALNHPHCAKFCVLGGASCSA